MISLAYYINIIYNNIMIKYNVKLKTENVFTYPYNPNIVLSSDDKLKHFLKEFTHRLKFKGMTKLSDNFNKNTTIDEFLKTQKKKYKKEVKYYNKNIKLSIKLMEYSEEYQDTGFVEAFHTSLRKYCESSQAWGLWQWISYSFDDKELVELTNAFWKMMYASFEETKAKNLEINETKKTSYHTSKFFKENMEEWRNKNPKLLLEEEKIRQQYYIMIALFDGLVQSTDFEHVCYAVLSE